MNKKAILYFLLIALVIFGLSSCVSNKGIDKAHNSKNSLDWSGVYTGTIPAADVPGINVRLILHQDQSFELSYEYLEKPNAHFYWAGLFTWDRKGNTIFLNIKDAPPYYKVEENRLIQLDMNGKPISGNFADSYVLKKNSEK